MLPAVMRQLHVLIMVVPILAIMKASLLGKPSLCRSIDVLNGFSRSLDYTCIYCQHVRPPSRRFATSTKRFNRETKQRYKGPFRTRLRAALRDTKVQWRPLPIGLGIAFLGAAQFYRVQQREKRRKEEEEAHEKNEGERDQTGRPTRRKRVRPSGPW